MPFVAGRRPGFGQHFRRGVCDLDPGDRGERAVATVLPTLASCGHLSRGVVESRRRRVAFVDAGGTAICHSHLPQHSASAECSVPRDSRDGVAKRFSATCSAVVEQPLHRLPVSTARVRHLRFGCPKQRRNPVTRLASHRRACPVTHGVASKGCGSAPSLEGNHVCTTRPQHREPGGAMRLVTRFLDARATRLSLS